MQRTHILFATVLLLVAAGIVAALVALAVSSNEDMTPPVISDVSASFVMPSSAGVTWTTDEPATSDVKTSHDYVGIGPVEGEVNLPALVTSHAVLLTPLEPDTTYTYRVASADAAGNEAVSEQYTFTTPPLH